MQAGDSSTLVFRTRELHPVLAWAVGGPVLLFFAVPLLTGAVPLLSVSGLFAVPFLLLGLAPIVLRRTAVLDATQRTVTVSWGKPFAFFTRRPRRWDEFAAVWTEPVRTRRGMIHRVYLSGEAGRVLVTESRSEAVAAGHAERIAQLTGLPG